MYSFLIQFNHFTFLNKNEISEKKKVKKKRKKYKNRGEGT